MFFARVFSRNCFLEKQDRKKRVSMKRARMKRLEASSWPVFLDISFTGSQKTARKNKFTRQKNSVIATLVVVLVLQNLGISFCKTSSFGHKEGSLFHVEFPNLERRDDR